MLKVRNKKLVTELARTTYKANKKRNLLTVFAIFLTTLLIAVILALGTGYWESVSRRQLLMQGMDYDIELSEPREDQAETIRAMDTVKYAGVAVKCAVLQNYKDRRLEKTRLFYLDEICWEKQTIPALENWEGSYPVAENEILFSESTLKSMGIEEPVIGMKLPVTYFTLDEESGGELLEKEFTLCGWYVDYSGSSRGYVSKAFFETTGVKQTDYTQGTLKITLKNPLYSEKDITKMVNAIDVDRNQVISADYDTIRNFCNTVLVLAGMLAMVFASGYLFIYNTMYISISADIRYYGQLRTVGMTSAQLGRLVYLSAIWNAAAGIPAGLLTAALLGKIVIPGILRLMNPTLPAKGVSWVNAGVFLVAGCFAFITDVTACQKPAKMARDCSPVEAMRYTAVRGNGKKRRRDSVSLGSMARQNMFRDRKQAVVILASFVIALSVFLVVNIVVRENDARQILREVMTYDMEFRNETTLEDDRQNLITAEKIDRLEKTEGVKAVRKVYSATALIPYQEEVYGEYYRELYQSRYSPGNYQEDMEQYRQDPDSDRFSARLIAVDEAGFDILNERLGNVLEWEAFEKGETAVAIKTFTEGDNHITGKTVRFSLPDGVDPEREHTVRIAAVGDIYDNPAYFAGGYSPDLVVSESYARELLGELFTELIYVAYEKPYSRKTEERVREVFAEDKQISSESRLERYLEMKNTENQVRVLGGSIGLIIALLAVLNYVNMMAATVQNRSRELATLESIGMTGSQIKKMLSLEGLGYAAISICLSLLIGLPAGYAVFRGTSQYQISFSVPWAGNLLLFSVVLLLCMAVPAVIYQRTQNRNIIERLRMDQE